MTKDYWAMFMSKLPEADVDNPHPKGWSVILRFVEKLRRQGLNVEDPDNWPDSGYSVDCTLNGRRIYFFLSSGGRQEARWVICCTADIGIVDRLRNRAPDEERRQLAEAVDRALKEGDEFSGIRWYRDAFRGDPDEAWTTTPS